MIFQTIYEARVWHFLNLFSRVPLACPKSSSMRRSKMQLRWGVSNILKHLDTFRFWVFWFKCLTFPLGILYYITIGFPRNKSSRSLSIFLVFLSLLIPFLKKWLVQSSILAQQNPHFHCLHRHYSEDLRSYRALVLVGITQRLPILHQAPRFWQRAEKRELPQRWWINGKNQQRIFMLVKQ